jgi:7,8-dihydropterin-6-yl-methyl-4-(beta-D-ribofuranosyl)aminobenzene 5'-phosphate synthase
MSFNRLIFYLLCCRFLLISALSIAQSNNRITILVDAFGQNATLKQDWGFSALVEFEGKRILFDTGNNADYFAYNTKALKVDLTNLDFVVISHRHGDHTDGLHHLLKVNPKVKIYVPNDEYFGGPTPAVFFKQKVESLPAHMRYFSGKVPAHVPHGSPWKEANLIRVDSLIEVMPGVILVRNLAPGKQFGETPELSLRLDTPKGGVLLVGCSHPGIERILQSVSGKSKPIGLLIGGLHLVNTEQGELERLIKALHQDWRIQAVAPGHCSGEPAFALFKQAFKEQYHYAGVGSILTIP